MISKEAKTCLRSACAVTVLVKRHGALAVCHGSPKVAAERRFSYNEERRNTNVHTMYQTSSNFPTVDFWNNDMAGHTANSLDDFGSGLRTSPDLGRRSCSPDPLSHADKNQLQFESVLSGQQTFPMHQTSAPSYQPQTVSYLPETVNAVWQSLSQRVPAFEKVCPLKKYTFEASQCCASPRIRIVHDCCNKETPVRELVDEGVLPRRTYPTKLSLCRFCLKNGEPPSVYYSHSLHQDDGRVACPVLRRYDCPICKNGGGDFAHTVRYCPALRAGIRR